MKTKKAVESKPYDIYGRAKARGTEEVSFTVKVKPRSIMGDYIALHGLLPENELPEHLRHKIPENEIWIQKDVYDDPKRRERVLQDHEKFELELMERKGLTYKQAHYRAEYHERVYRVEDEVEKIEEYLKIKTRDSVKVVEPKQELRKMKPEARQLLGKFLIVSSLLPFAFLLSPFLHWIVWEQLYFIRE
jgi:hypothetical protein